MKLILITLFFIKTLFSAEFDLNKFEDRQDVIEDIRALIVYEEKLAVNYEKFILNNFKKPLIKDLTESIEPLNLKKLTPIDLTFTNDKFNLRIPTTIPLELQDLYKSNKYRNRTYIYDTSVSFTMEDEFARHILGLINYNNKSEIQNCPSGDSTANMKVCKYNNHFYFTVTKTVSDLPTEYVMAYYMGNFKVGPIAFESTLPFSNDIFKNIPFGAILYDFDGQRYIKTKNGLQTLQGTK